MYIKINVCLYVAEFLLKGWTDFDKIVCLCMGGVLDGLNSQLYHIGPTRTVAQTGILRFAG